MIQAETRPPPLLHKITTINVARARPPPDFAEDFLAWPSATLPALAGVINHAELSNDLSTDLDLDGPLSEPFLQMADGLVGVRRQSLGALSSLQRVFATGEHVRGVCILGLPDQVVKVTWPPFRTGDRIESSKQHGHDTSCA